MERISETKMLAVRAKCRDDGVPEEQVLKHYRLNSLADMTEAQHNHMIKYWDHFMGMNNNGK
jgi:hypothetical protein